MSLFLDWLATLVNFSSLFHMVSFSFVVFISICTVLFVFQYISFAYYYYSSKKPLFFCWHCYASNNMIICPCLLGARHGCQNKNLSSEGPQSKAEIYLEVCRASNC